MYTLFFHLIKIGQGRVFKLQNARMTTLSQFQKLKIFSIIPTSIFNSKYEQEKNQLTCFILGIGGGRNLMSKHLIIVNS